MLSDDRSYARVRHASMVESRWVAATEPDSPPSRSTATALTDCRAGSLWTRSDGDYRSSANATRRIRTSRAADGVTAPVR